MKRILVILVPLLPIFISAQQKPGQSFIYTNAGFAWSTTVLEKVDSIATCSTAKNGAITVSDSIRGGTFVLYAGSNPVDNGMIFQDASGNKWIRQSTADYIDIRWFGAKTDGSDSRSAIIASLNSATINFPKKRVFIAGEYYSSDSINVNSTVEIFGEGNESKIRFAAHKTGLTFTYPGSQYSKLTNITILGDANSFSNPLSWNIAKHGIVVKSPVDFNGVWVRYFDGCGIYIVNDLTSEVPGNSNTSTFNDCHAYQNLLHGIYIKGGDVNAMSFTNCDIVSNGGVGIYDKSFLGNNYAYNHVASNGSPEIPYQRGLVKSGGTVYACIKDTTLNIAPPNATYWQDVGTAWLSYPNVLDYSAATTYYAVSSIILEGANQYGTSTSNYVETDQAPGYIDQNNLNINGNIQTRALYPTTIYASSGKIRSKASFVGEYGISSRWLYGGDMGNSVNGYVVHPNYSGLMLGSTDKSADIQYYDNNVKIAESYTNSTSFNTLITPGKKYIITTDTINIVGKLLNNGTEISGGGISQATLDDSTAQLRTAIDGKQPIGTYLTTTGNGSGLTGLTKTQVGLANVDNTSDASKPISTATQTALDGKQATLVSNTNIKTVGGQTLLGNGNIVTTNSQTFIPLANNFSSTSTTPAAVTGWSFAVTSGITYRIQVVAAYQTAATTTGGILGISLTGATGTVRGSARGSVVSTAAATELVIGIVATSGAGSTLTTTGVTAINSPHQISMDIVFVCTGTGTFNIVWGSEVNSSAAQINQNSALIYQALN